MNIICTTRKIILGVNFPMLIYIAIFTPKLREKECFPIKKVRIEIFHIKIHFPLYQMNEFIVDIKINIILYRSL